MVPGLGKKFDIDIEIVEKPRADYGTEAYSRAGLPAAPAIAAGGEVIVQGKDIEEAELEKAISGFLGG